MLNSKILIIDDELAVRKTILSALKNAGYELLFAENGKEGLELYQEHNPLLIILDLKMPIMDGVEFLETIKLAPADPCSVIVLTGHGRDEDVEKCFDLGVSAFLRKPFNFYELNGLVRHSITLKKNEEELKKHRDHLEELVKERTNDLERTNKHLKSTLKQLKGAFNELRENSAFTDHILHSMTDTLLVVSPEATIQRSNLSLCNLLGYEENELIGKPVNIIFGDKNIREGMPYEDFIKEVLVKNREKEYFTKDGEKIPVLFSGSLMNDEKGKTIAIICAAQDITELKQTEDALLEMEERIS